MWSFKLFYCLRILNHITLIILIPSTIDLYLKLCLYTSFIWMKHLLKDQPDRKYYTVLILRDTILDLKESSKNTVKELQYNTVEHVPRGRDKMTEKGASKFYLKKIRSRKWIFKTSPLWVTGFDLWSYLLGKLVPFLNTIGASHYLRIINFTKYTVFIFWFVLSVHPIHKSLKIF